MNSTSMDQFVWDRGGEPAHLASVTAACIASSICCPAAACSSGMGTASSRPLPWDSESALAAKNPQQKTQQVRFQKLLGGGR